MQLPTQLITTAYLKLNFKHKSIKTIFLHLLGGQWIQVCAEIALTYQSEQVSKFI